MPVAELLGELLERCRQGQADAIRLLVVRFQNWARDLAEAILGDSHLAEDAVQAAFVRALARLGDLRDPAAFPGWLRQIVRTECGRMTRGRKEDRLPKSADPPSPAPTPGQEAERVERDCLVRQAMQSLPPAGRRAAELFYFDDLSCSEVAELLHVPVGTVKRRLHDAREKLRQTLSRQLPL
jgi:RNA polymerase sigma factor (sigma-70 family)